MTGRSEPYRVFLVDDHGVFRSGVRAELASETDMAVVGEAGAVADAIAGILQSSPDVVLLAVHMPAGGGIAVLRGVADAAPQKSPVFLALSVSDAAEDVIATIRAVPAAMSPRRSAARSWPIPCVGSQMGTPCSVRDWPDSCSIRSPGNRPCRNHIWIPNSIR